MHFGDNIRILRKNSGMTQKQLAARLSLSASTIGMYEQNRRVPDPAIIRELAKIFNVSPREILGEDTDDYFLEDLPPNKEEESAIVLSKQELKFLDTFRKLNEDNRDIILGDMKRYLKEQNYTSPHDVAADCSF